MYEHHDHGTAWSPAISTRSGILWTDAFSSVLDLPMPTMMSFFERDGQEVIVHGVLGLHVDDLIGVGE